MEQVRRLIVTRFWAICVCLVVLLVSIVGHVFLYPGPQCWGMADISYERAGETALERAYKRFGAPAGLTSIDHFTNSPNVEFSITEVNKWRRQIEVDNRTGSFLVNFSFRDDPDPVTIDQSQYFILVDSCGVRVSTGGV
ncbi:MAG: hypothetical protein AAF950_17265 [Pseudomonadota bacterium]